MSDVVFSMSHVVFATCNIQEHKQLQISCKYTAISCSSAHYIKWPGAGNIFSTAVFAVDGYLKYFCAAKLGQAAAATRPAPAPTVQGVEKTAGTA